MLENYQHQEASKATTEEDSTAERPEVVENSVEPTDSPIDANELEPNVETPDIPIYMPESERPTERTQDEMRESDSVESSEIEDSKFGQRYEMTEAENPSESMSYPDEYTGWGVHLSSDEIESNISKFDRRSSEELEQELEDLAYDLRVHMEDDFIDRDFVEETSREIAEIDAELKRRKAKGNINSEETPTADGENHTIIASYTNNRGAKSDVYIDSDTTDKDGVRTVTFGRIVTKPNNSQINTRGYIIIADDMIDWERTCNGIDAHGKPRSANIDPDEVKRTRDAWSNPITGELQDFKCVGLKYGLNGKVVAAYDRDGVKIYLKHDPLEPSEKPAQSVEASRVPLDENGNPKFEEMPDPKEAWSAMVERYKGEDGAHTVASIMASKASKELEEVRKETPRLADMPALNEADYTPDYSKASSPDEIFEIYEEVNRRKKADADRVAAVEEQNRALLKAYSDKVSAAEKKVEAWSNIAKQYDNNTSEVANTFAENTTVDTSKEVAAAEKTEAAMDQMQPTNAPTQSDAVAHILDIARGGKPKPKPKAKPKTPNPKNQEVASKPIGEEPEVKQEAKEQKPTAKVEAKNNTPKQGEDKTFKPTATSEDIKSKLAAILGGGSNDGLRFRDTGLSREQEKEVYRLGVDLAFEYFDQGITDFDAFAKEMIGYVGDSIRPWVKSFYEGAKMTPRYDDIEFSTSDYVRSFDISKIGVPIAEEPATEPTPQAEETSKPTAEPKTTKSANVESKPTKGEKAKSEKEEESLVEKPRMNGTDYAVGTHVSYRSDAGVMECEIEEVLPNGNFNLKAPSIYGIPQMLMNIPKESLHIPGTDDAIRYYYDKFDASTRSLKRTDLEHYEELLWGQILKCEEMASNGPISFEEAEKIARVIGRYLSINDRLGGFQSKYSHANKHLEHEIADEKKKAISNLLSIIGYKPENPTDGNSKKRQSKNSESKPSSQNADEPKADGSNTTETAVSKSEKTENNEAPKLEGISETPDPKEQAFVADAIERLVDDKQGKMTNLEVRALIKKHVLEISEKDAQELVEWALNDAIKPSAEKACKLGFESKEARVLYDKAVMLYERQPNLTAMDRTREKNQQFSTPIPMTFVSNMFLTHGREVKQAFEPTAGNGAGFIGIPYRLCHMNEIDPRRVQNLVNQGYKNVTMQNALLQFKCWCDTIFANPPFGTLPVKKSYDGGIFDIGKLENVMSINALNTMSDNGRAVLVIGGHLGANPTPYAENGRLKSLEDRQFFSYLYSHYNVVDIIPIDGKALYSRNGTGYPVRMILIDGRRRDANGNVIREVTNENRAYAPVLDKVNNETVKTYDELYERIKQNALSLRKQPSGSGYEDSSESGREGDMERNIQNNLASDANGAGSMAVSEHGISETGGAGVGSSSGTTRGRKPARPSKSDERNNEHGASASSGSEVSRKDSRGGRTADGVGGGKSNTPRLDDRGEKPKRVRRLSAEEEEKIDKDVVIDAGEENVESPRMSRGNSLGTRMPAQQAVAYQNALRRHRDKHGDIDEYVASKLGYGSTDEMFTHLAAEQIEGVGLAIDCVDNGRGFIIGDQTGIGKGRQAASIIRYANKQGKKPIFFTIKPMLFTDIYRDLCDIGTDNLRPFIFASDSNGNISTTDENGNIKTVYKTPSAKETERVLSYIEEHGELPPEYDYAVITYSQISNGCFDYEAGENGKLGPIHKQKKKGKGYSSAELSGQRRRDVLEKLSKDNYLILDEAHAAGGQSNSGRYMQYILPNTKGTVYLSATYAKEPKNMPIYAIKTSIGECGISHEDIISAVTAGGLPIQEMMSQRLVEAGEMIRRERDFRGMQLEWTKPTEEDEIAQRKAFTEVSKIAKDIMHFQDTYVRGSINELSFALAGQGAMAGLKRGTEGLGISNEPFVSKLFQLNFQTLFALKPDQTVALADAAIKNGEHVGICFVNTMEAFIENLKVPPGGFDEMPTMSEVLRSALNGVLRYTIKDQNNNETHQILDPSELPEGGAEEFDRIAQEINTMSAKLPISPLDDIIMKLEEKGHTVREVSGRELCIAKNQNGKYIVKKRENTDRKKNVHDWNQGDVDVLVHNKAGSTGISMHASPKFKNQDPRRAIFACKI